MDILQFDDIVRKYITNGKTEDAITTLANFVKGKNRDLTNQITVIAGRFQQIKNRKTTGLKVSDEEKAEIDYSILQTLTTIEKNFEDEFWGSVKALNSLKAYEQYIELYYDGKYLDEAQEKVEEWKLELRRQEEEIINEQEEKRRQDDTDWNYAKGSNGIEDYNAYLEKYPNGRHSTQARKIITELFTEINLKRLSLEAELAYDKFDKGIATYVLSNERGKKITVIVSPIIEGDVLLFQIASLPLKLNGGANLANLFKDMLKINSKNIYAYWALLEDDEAYYAIATYTGVAVSMTGEEFKLPVIQVANLINGLG